MGKSISLLIPGDSNTCGPNKKYHWQARRRLVNRWKQNTDRAIQQRLDIGLWSAKRVRITFTLFRGRVLDPDNAASSFALKAVCDQLVAHGFFPDDSAKHVCYAPIRQVTGAQFRHQPAVQVELEEWTDGV